MSSTYSTSLQIQEIGNGEQSGTWGTTTNNNWVLMEQAVAGVTTITMANTNYTLSVINGAPDEARSMNLIVKGTNSAIYQVVAPLAPKIYNVVNLTVGGYAITIGGSTGATVSVPNGYATFVYCDGINFYSANTTSAGAFYVNGALTASGIADVGNLSVSGSTALSGTATAPTVTPSTDNSTKIATTAFVQSVAGGLGTMASQNANNVAITGGTMAGVTISGGNAITSSNIGSQSVSYATTAGNGGVTSVNGSTGAVTVYDIGVGQNWSTPSRSAGTTYTNSTGRAIAVSVYVSGGTHSGGGYLYVNGVLVSSAGGYDNGGVSTMFAIVPPGQTYSVSLYGINPSVANWAELS